MVFGTQENPLLHFAGPCPDAQQYQSAICPDLCTITESLFLLNTLCLHKAHTGGLVAIYNDGSKALHLINNIDRTLKCFLANDYDLHNESRLLLQKLHETITINLLWIKGHYTGEKHLLEHDLNDEAHCLATTHLTSIQNNEDLLVPSLEVSLSL